MNDVRAKYVPPSVDETAFNCPHCGALAKQFWYTVYADRAGKDQTPNLVGQADVEMLTFDNIEDASERARLREMIRRMAAGVPFFGNAGRHADFDVPNLWISSCFNCSDIAVWVYNRMIWPCRGQAALPAPDLPEHIRKDYEEASTILDLSPRGAAALLRLCIQKLCKHIGEKGENLNADIAALVRKGLDQRVQKALDIVRVVGNNAVHPGQIDIGDDRATAEKLFTLVNLVADVMISEPGRIAAL